MSLKSGRNPPPLPSNISQPRKHGKFRPNNEQAGSVLESQIDFHYQVNAAK
jgi:hypothetical protein